AEAARGLGHLELGAGFGNDQVAFQHDAECEAQRIAVRCSDNRLPVDRADQQIARISAPALRSAERLELFALAQLTLVHVRTAGKSAALAADDRDLRLGVEIETPQRVHQVPDQLVAERVELLRPVQGQGRDLILASVFDKSLGHSGSYPTSRLDRSTPEQPLIPAAPRFVLVSNTASWRRAAADRVSPSPRALRSH